MLPVDSLHTRVRRFHNLYRQSAPEAAIPHAEDNDPLLYLERRANKEAMHSGLGGLEGARSTLATGIQRLEE
jgi:hypothetical protein